MIKESIESFKKYLVNDIYIEEVCAKTENISCRGDSSASSEIIMLQSYLQNLQNRLFAINDLMLTNTINRPDDFSLEYRAESDYLNRTLHNEIKIKPAISRTISMYNHSFSRR